MIKKKSSLVTSPYFHWASYGLLVSVRLSLIIFQSSGYLHPDEFFQSVELATHDIYVNSCSFRPWEFEPQGYGPVRSRSSIYPFVHLPIKVASHLFPFKNFSSLSGNEIIERLLLPPRFMTTLLSFIPDAFIVWLTRKLERGSQRKAPLALLLYSSMAYGGLLWNTRTMSNVWECAMVCVFCYLSLQSTLTALIIQSALSAWGVFLRPTFPVFVIPFIVLQLFSMIRSPGRKFKVFFYILIGLLVVCMVSVFLAFLDTLYYTRENLSPDMIVTPIRFLTYNSAHETLAEHGLHPWYQYIFICWPLILTPPFVLLALFPPLRKGFNDPLRYATWLNIIIPTLVFSLIGHKEVRFLLPSIPFAITLIGSRIKMSKPLLVFWLAYQAILMVVWGFVHQAGLLPFLRSLPPVDASEVSLNIFYKTYMPPRFAFGEPVSPLLTVPFGCRKLAPFGSAKCTRLVDFAGRPESEVIKFMDCLKTYAPANTVVRLILPGTVLPWRKPLDQYGKVLSVDKYFPHLSTEDLPALGISGCSTNRMLSDCLYAYWKKLKAQLSLYSYKISLS